MATTTPYRYPLDITGVNPDNLVEGDIRTLPNRPVRAVCPSYGAYYTEGLIVKDVATQQVLVKNVDYYCAELFRVPTDRYGKEICGIIVIKNAAVSTSVELTYQCLGGDYSTNSEALVQMLATLELDNRPVTWPNVVHKPDAFPPAPHFHDAGDIYGFEYVVHALDRVATAIETGDDAAHDVIYRYIDDAIAANGGQNSGLLQLINDHINNTSNPHSTTKVQVGLGNVDNYLTATQVQAEGGIVNDAFMTPLRTKQAVLAIVGNAFTTHVNNTSNPHGTTKAQVGLGSVDNFATASTAQAQAGSANNLFMTPLGVSQYVAAWATASGVGGHVIRTDNPHNTTATQIGLGSVFNYGIASQVDAQQGTRNDLYMTPLRTAEAIAAMASSGGMAAHIANINNPHSTTAAQVGLGSVDNFPTATVSEAQLGLINTAFMTPVRVSQYVANWQTANGVLAHLNNSSNPHGVTSAQVGLGNVSNYPTASDAIGAAGLSSTHFMTPASTKAAILALGGSGSTAWSAITGKPNTIAGYNITDAANSGANSNITSLSGLSTPLSVSQGGTGSNGPAGARANLGLVIGQDVHPYQVGLLQINTSGATFTGTGGVTGYSFTSSTVINAGGQITGSSFSTTGGITASGVITGGQLASNNTITCAGNISTVSISTTGNAVIGTTLSVGGSITAGGDITAFSDERLKRNMTRITNALERLLQIEGITYVRKSDDSHAMGVSAQKTQEVFPELVTKHENSFLSVAYANFVGPVIEALRELNTYRLEDRQEIQSLRQELAALRG